MKNFTYGFGTLALALSMSGLPAVAFAENGGGEDGAVAQVQVTAVTTAAPAGLTGERAREWQKQQVELSREEQKQQIEASSTGGGRPSIKGGEREGQEIDLDLEDDSSPATSFGDLKQKIEVRKRELEQEVASTSPDHQNIVENTNPVRLAVHTLLSSKNLVGGIGPQVSEIAKQMNDSIATTTNAEAKIQSRGFLARLFFGGDSTSAEVIAQQAAQNQERIDKLTALLGQANVPADVQATLEAQITALKDAQARLQDLAQREQRAWGLFSWRF